MTKILLIEEHSLFRRSLESLINTFDCCQVVKEYTSLDAIPKLSNELAPDLILISIHNILESASLEIEKSKMLFPLSNVIVLSEGISRPEFSTLVKLDVYGFFSIKAAPSELEQILCSYDKYHVVNQMKIDSYSKECLRTKNNHDPIESIDFSQRELEVLNLVCMEKTNCEISKTLGLSVRTIESYRRQMIIKMGCKNMVGVIIKTLQYSDFKQKWTQFMA